MRNNKIIVTLLVQHSKFFPVKTICLGHSIMQQRLFTAPCEVNGYNLLFDVHFFRY